jgi:peptidoglycan/LPS O-acetylase OafA/YrhL
MKPNYRKEIDGLRAIAVLLVVVYHGFPNFLKGGFLGVDIFFVLSGFLITGIISTELNTAVFNLRQFYLNRIRRIFPSLLVVMMTFLVAGWFVLRSEEYIQLGNETLAGSFFYSNFLYLSQNNYFDVASDLKPFLHLWSLSIEEQFYLLYPFILLFLNRFSKNRRLQITAISTLALVSFMFCVLIADSPSRAFFLPMARWWELLLGGVLALSTRKGRINVAHPNLFALGGFVSIAVGVVLASVIESFSTYMGLTVVVGTLLLIASGQDSSLVQSTIGRKLPVEIGKISYPLYLWHWPILVLARIHYGRNPPGSTRLLLIIFAFVLAWVTTRFIEKPIRFGFRRAQTIVVLSCVLVLTGFAGAAVSINDGFPGRPANNQQIGFEGDTGHIQFHKYISDNFFPCTPADVYQSSLAWEGYVRCNQSKQDQPIEVLLLGDSHAEHFFIGLAESLENKNVGFYIRSVPINRTDPEFNLIYSAAIANPAIKTVILGNMWTARDTSENELVAIFRELIDSGKQVFITDDIPVFDIDPDACKFTGVCPKTIPYSAMLQNPNYLKLISATNAVPEVTLIKTYEYLCNDGEGCAMHNEDQILYRDANHLNIIGSQIIGKFIARDYPALEK